MDVNNKLILNTVTDTLQVYGEEGTIVLTIKNPTAEMRSRLSDLSYDVNIWTRYLSSGCVVIRPKPDYLKI
jgi:hypothetical protein